MITGPITPRDLILGGSPKCGALFVVGALAIAKHLKKYLSSARWRRRQRLPTGCRPAALG